MAAAQQERQQLRQQLQQIQQLHREETRQIVRENEMEVVKLRQQLQEMQQVHKEAVSEIERQLGQMRQHCEQERASFEKQLVEKDRQLHELEGQLQQRSKDKNHQEAARNVVRRENIKLAWREGMKAPISDRRWCDAVVEGSKVYFLLSGNQFYTYNFSGKGWSQLPNYPFSGSSLVILNGQPTTVGGNSFGIIPFINKLMSLTADGKWMEKFPPMPTKRMFVAAVCTGTVLIVAGGVEENFRGLTTVEVLNFENGQWSTAVDLLESLNCYSTTVHGDQLYMLGDNTGKKSVYTCSVSALLQTCSHKSSLAEHTSALSLSNSSSGGKGVWCKLPDLPITYSIGVTFCGQLLAVGGEDSDRKSTTAVYMYNQATNSWNVISHLTIYSKN